MGNQSNRILPHKDPAVTTTTQKQQTSRRVRQRQTSLRRSWNPQEQPRRRVQRRSSVTKYNLEDSMAKVQQEEEQQTVISTTAAAAEQNPTSTCHSMLLPDHKDKQKIKKRKIRLLPFSFSGSGRPCNKSKNSSRNRLQCLRKIQPFGRRYHCADTSTTPSTTVKSSGSSSVHRSCQQQEAVAERSRPFRLWFRKSKV